MCKRVITPLPEGYVKLVDVVDGRGQFLLLTIRPIPLFFKAPL